MDSLPSPSMPNPGGEPPASASEPQSDEPSQRQSGADRAAALARKLRKAEKELASFRDAEQQRKTAELSEADKHKQTAEQIRLENEKLKSELRTTRLQSVYEREAAKAGIPASHLEAAMKLADLSEVDLDDPATIKDALAAQRKAYPFLFGAPSTPAPEVGGGGGNPGKGPATMSPERLMSLSPSEFAALSEDVKAGRVKF